MSLLIGVCVSMVETVLVKKGKEVQCWGAYTVRFRGFASIERYSTNESIIN